jgi:hypothetical protein
MIIASLCQDLQLLICYKVLMMMRHRARCWARCAHDDDELERLRDATTKMLMDSVVLAYAHGAGSRHPPKICSFSDISSMSRLMLRNTSCLGSLASWGKQVSGTISICLQRHIYIYIIYNIHIYTHQLSEEYHRSLHFCVCKSILF